MDLPSRRFGYALVAAIGLGAALGVGRHVQRHTQDPAWAPLRPTPPSTPRDEIVEDIHGVAVADPYRWLERADDPAVQAWSDAQDTYARTQLDGLPDTDALRTQLRHEWDHEGIVVPVHKRGERYFYGKRLRGHDRIVYFVREGDGPERVLLDPADFGPAHAITGLYPSPDGSKVAYRVSFANADAATMHVRDVATRRDDPADTIRGARFTVADWLPDGRGFVYTAVPDDPSIPPAELAAHARVQRHTLGTPVADDPVEFGPLGDARRILLPRLSDDGRYLLVHATHGSAGPIDIWVRDLHAESGAFEPLVVGADARTSAIGYRGALYLHTSDGAPRFRVVKVDPQRLGRGYWREVVPQDAMTLQDVAIMEGHLVLSYLLDANARVRVHALDSGRSWDVALPEHGAVTGLWGNPENREVLLAHSSLSQRPAIYRVPLPRGDVAIASADAWYTPPNDADEVPLTMQARFVASADGTKIPLFVMHRADLSPDEPHPTVLYGYGGFGVSVPPAYNSVARIWAERGGVWAQANLRGGGEYGEAWHRAGTGARKQNVFDDFVAAAQSLVDTGVTRPAQLGIMGGSNGGLLVGAASTQRPDLFGAVVCRVPLLDMVRYHRFGVAPFWIDEYGSSEDATQFRTLLAYSPYHQIREGTLYPPLLMMAADHDDRVDPLHARKYVAAMQAASPHRALLRVERNAGHGGPASLSQTIDATAHMLAFLLDALGEPPVAG